jgi:hypothetical protein
MMTNKHGYVVEHIPVAHVPHLADVHEDAYIPDEAEFQIVPDFIEDRYIGRTVQYRGNQVLDLPKKIIL